jgi:hypothetical protein
MTPKTRKALEMARDFLMSGNPINAGIVCTAITKALAEPAPPIIDDLYLAKATVRAAGYSLVTQRFIINFAEFIQAWRKGDFDLPERAACEVRSCFDAWQKPANQVEVTKPAPRRLTEEEILGIALFPHKSSVHFARAVEARIFSLQGDHMTIPLTTATQETEKPCDECDKFKALLLEVCILRNEINAAYPPYSLALGLRCTAVYDAIYKALGLVEKDRWVCEVKPNGELVHVKRQIEGS